MQHLRVPIQHGPNHSHDGDANDVPSLGSDLEHQAAKILSLLAKFELSCRDLVSIAWEREYEGRDLIEQIQGLDQLIQTTISLMGPALAAQEHQLSSQSLSALGRYFDERVIREKSKNWELGYQWRDAEEDLLKLRLQLRSSVPVEDIAHPPWRPRTAMERSLEVRIVELEDRLRNPKGRGRSSSV